MRNLEYLIKAAEHVLEIEERRQQTERMVALANQESFLRMKMDLYLAAFQLNGKTSEYVFLYHLDGSPMPFGILSVLDDRLEFGYDEDSTNEGGSIGGWYSLRLRPEESSDAYHGRVTGWGQVPSYLQLGEAFQGWGLIHSAGGALTPSDQGMEDTARTAPA